MLVTLNVPEPEPQQTHYPNLKLVLIHNRHPQGFGANHNTAYQRCATPWFAVLNPDLRVPTDPFPALMTSLKHTPHLGVAAPRVLNSAGHQEDHVRRNLSLASIWRRRRGIAEPVDTSSPAKRPAPFYWLAGMFLLFNSEAYRAVGGFDERFFLYCEDYDICARLYAAGYAVQLVAEASVVHDAQRDSHRSARHLRWHMASLAKVWCSQVFWKITLGV